MRNEKSLNRYREEQNLGETDMSLAGFVYILIAKKQLNRKIYIGYSSLREYVC